MAWLLSTCCDTFTIFGTTGVGAGAGGGGGVSGMSTTGVLPVPPEPRLLPTGVGGSAFIVPITESDRAGGTVGATVPGWSGTRFGFEVLLISSVRMEDRKS